MVYCLVAVVGIGPMAVGTMADVVRAMPPLFIAVIRYPGTVECRIFESDAIASGNAGMLFIHHARANVSYTCFVHVTGTLFRWAIGELVKIAGNATF